jgi:hypothetical protein
MFALMWCKCTNHCVGSAHTISNTWQADPVKTATEVAIVKVKVEEDVKVEIREQAHISIKVEEDNASLLSTCVMICLILFFKLTPSWICTQSDCTVSPCYTLTKRCGNPDPNPIDPYAPWRHVVRPFHASNLPTNVAKRKAFHEERYGKHCRLGL